MATAMAAAVRQRQWEWVALCLLLGLVRALDQVPPGALPELLALAAGEPPERP